ncbi:MAG: hypothetical protein SOZ96_06795 [Treponema sp.]|nr:hypothetical protein [Treponema sp.]MDY3722284.1 hypothetical protein [Treponema sp.]
MKVDETELSENEISCIKKAVKDRQPIDFFCYTLTPDQKIRFQKILAIFLEECNQMYLYNYLTYCLFELLDNGSKANAKRIFFQEHHLDINNEDDYKNGMKTFKETLLENTLHYQEKLKAGELRVHLLLTANDVISVTVSNNTKITDSEYARIQDKINKTKVYNSIAEAVSDIDQTEGSGLGIITVLVMLKKLGLDANNLKFDTTENETVATIEIPKDTIEEI